MKSLKPKPVDASGRNWMLPFNDMMTLLLTFFVLILSMSKIDATKVKSASQAVSDYLGMAAESDTMAVRVFDPFVFENPEEAALPPGSRPWGTKEDQMRFLDVMNGMSGVKATRADQHIEVAFNEGLLFRSGEAVPAFAQHPGVQEILDVLRRSSLTVRIEDHTMDDPRDADRYASSWELSAARAAHVAALLNAAGIAPGRISISGADTRQSAVSLRGVPGLKNHIDFILTFKRN